MAEEISPQALLADLAAHLQALNAQSNQVNMVSIELPELWAKSPEVWFSRVEAQFGSKGITQNQTKYDHVISGLDIKRAEKIPLILINPPIDCKCNKLMNALIKTFGKSQNQKDAELLNLNGLGDKRPTALDFKINSLNDPQTLKRELFLANLPSDVRRILAGPNITDTDTLN